MESRTVSQRSPVSERRYLTIVFVDLVGFTQLSERLDPEDLRLLQRRYQNLALTIMERFGGFVAQFTGDGILVYFGYPVAHENDAERALRASLELIKRLEGLDTHVKDDVLPPLAARVGVHTGLVLIGPEMLSSGVTELSAIGEAVNLAARLQAEAPPGGVVVTRETSRLVEGKFQLEEMGPRSVKGLSRKIVIYRVVAPLPTGRLGSSSPSSASQMIGRQSGLERVVDRWRIASVERLCQTVEIVGDAGVGKTRFVREFCSRPEVGEPTLLQAACHELFSSTPLYPLRSFLSARAGLLAEDDLATQLQKISTFLDELDLHSAESMQIIASVLGLESSGPLDEVAPTPLLLKRRQFDFVISVLRRVALARPTILWIEDAHWLDASSAELLREIVAALSNVPLLILLTRRSFPSEVELPGSDEVVRLEHLSKEESLELARLIPGARQLPQEVLDRVVDAAEGVPLFLEQFAISLIEEQSQATSRPPKQNSVPLMLAEMMSERLDRRPGARRIAQIAACIGRSFTPKFLGDLLVQAPNHVTKLLETLVEAEILLPRRYGLAIQYEFRHALLQRVAHESMLQSERQSTHQRIVEELHRLDQLHQAPAEVMAYHLTEAGDFPAAVQEWLRAGRGAAERSAHIEAIEHLQRGLDHLHKVTDAALRRQLELNIQAALVGSIVATEGATSIRVSQCCERGLELCRQGEPSPFILPFVFGQFTFMNCWGRVDEAASLAGLFLSLAENAGSESGRVIGHRMMGTILLGQGKALKAKEHLQLSLQLYSPERDARTTYQFGQSTEVHTKSTLSLVYFCLGEIDLALQVGIDALQSADMLRHPHSTAIPLSYVGGWVFGLCGATDHLLRESDSLIALSEQNRLAAFSAHGRGLHGWGLAQNGDLRNGASELEGAVAALDSIHFRLGISGYLGVLADVGRAMGDFKSATGNIKRALDLMAESSFLWLEPELRRIEALIVKEISPKDSTAAELAMRNALACARSLGFPIMEYRCLKSLKHLLGHGSDSSKVDLELQSLTRFGDLRTIVAKFALSGRS